MAEPQHITIADFLHAMFATAWDKLAAALAAGAILLPVWHPTLKEVSETSSLVAPILGCLWLTIQIIAKIWQVTRGK